MPPGVPRVKDWQLTLSAWSVSHVCECVLAVSSNSLLWEMRLDDSVSCWTVMTWITCTQHTDVRSTSNVSLCFMYVVDLIFKTATSLTTTEYFCISKKKKDYITLNVSHNDFWYRFKVIVLFADWIS